jgi:hypothetical protein
VRDEAGSPIEGAAVDLDGEVVYTNSAGEFFLRANHPRRYSIRVLTQEFLLPGLWEVVSAPGDVVASPEGRVVPMEIILRQSQPAAQ